MALSASDLPTIYSLLTNSMSGDESIRRPAEAALAQCEARPGFCSCLMVMLLPLLNTHPPQLPPFALLMPTHLNVYWDGYRLIMQEIITAKDLVSQAAVRLLASVYFKNSVNRYWRNRRDSLYDVLQPYSLLPFLSLISHFVVLISYYTIWRNTSIFTFYLLRAAFCTKNTWLCITKHGHFLCVQCVL